MAEQRVERRLTAILAADVVGYSRLMGADVTDTLARLKTLLEEVFDPQMTEAPSELIASILRLLASTRNFWPRFIGEGLDRTILSPVAIKATCLWPPNLN